jgi:PAS domain S-box-containing protein
LRILYVEDNPKDADLARIELARRAPHLKLEVVASRQAALSCLEQEPGYQVLLTDMHLPDGDGLSLLATVRKRGWPMAVVIITGGGDESTAVAALKGGADDYIVKRADYLPLLPQALEKAYARYRAEMARHARPLRVLYAEDNTSDINLTQRHLAQHARHIHVDVVYTAAEVLKRLPQRGPATDYDVVLLDYRLPGRNALEVLRELLQVRALDLPVVVVTGQGDEELALQVLRLGASDYVVKTPGYLYKLPSVVENAFHRAQLMREQAALRQSEARYRTLVEQIPAITYMCALDEAGTLLYVSPQAERILGYAPDDYAARPELWWQQLYAADSERVTHQLRQSRETGQPLRTEYRVVHRDGRLLWLRNEAVVVRADDQRPMFLQGVLVDLTDRKQAEEMLRQTNETLGAIIDASPLAITALDDEGRASMWNEAAERLFGWQAREVLGRPLPILPPAGQPSAGPAPETERLGQRQAGVELRRLRRDGTPVDVSLWTAPLRDAHGQINGLMALYADVGDRKRTAAQLVYQAQLLANIQEAVIATDASGRLTAWNRAAENLYGWAAQEVLGRPVSEVLPSDLTDKQAEIVQRSLQTLGHHRAEFAQYRRDGSPVYVEGITIALHDEAGQRTGSVSVYRDVSDRRQAEAERERLHRQVQTANARLQALSLRLLEVQESERRHLARELHDEIGQQLTGLKLILDMNAFAPGKPVRTSLVEAQELLGQLMQQVRELSLSLRPAMLDDLGLLPALIWHLERYTSQTGVQVNFKHSGIERRRLAPAVETAAYRIVQEALTNVARYAQVKEVSVRLWRETDALQLEVVDRGLGFNPHEVLAAARSNGLAGMSERAKLIGGQFKIESTRGVGTRLTAILPVAVVEPDQPEQAPRAEAAEREPGA